MLKAVVQRSIPDFILNKLKEKRYFKTLRDFKVSDEPDLIVAKELIDNKEFIDLGANIGIYTTYLSPFAKKIYSFEPVPLSFSLLSLYIQKFRLNNVDVHQIAVSDKVGSAVIEVPIYEGARNYYRANLTNSKTVSPSDMKYTVQTTTIDSFFADIPTEVSFIKCDVEGHELACILGAQKFIGQHKPAWLIEVSNNPDVPDNPAHKLFEIMEQYGYEVYFFDRQVLKKRNKGDKSINFFFLQNEHLDLLRKNRIVFEG